MAKDDYFVIVYRILVYYYACLKRKIIFDEQVFYAAIKKKGISDEYFASIIYMMIEDGLIKGIITQKAWGNEIIIVSDLSEGCITSKGIEYLQENEMMKKVQNILKDAGDIIASLASTLGLFNL